MTDEDRQDMNNLFLLLKAVKFNHETGTGSFKAKVNPEIEIERYQHRITQLSLPHRFGIYKPIKNAPKIENIKLETPTIQDSSDGPGGNQDPNHKRRSIFQ